MKYGLKMRIWSHLLQKPLMESFICCAVLGAAINEFPQKPLLAFSCCFLCDCYATSEKLHSFSFFYSFVLLMKNIVTLPKRLLSQTSGGFPESSLRKCCEILITVIFR